MGRLGAGAGDGIVHALETVLDGYVARAKVADHAWNEERRYLLWSALKVSLVVLLKHHEPADADAVYGALVGDTDTRAALPDNPTIGETLKGFGTTPWYGIFAPAGTPKAIVAQLNAEIAKALESKDVQERLAGVGCEPYKTSADQFGALVKSDLARWSGIVKASGASVD